MFGASRLALYAANPVASGLVTGGTTYFTGGFGSLTTVRKYNMVSGASSAGTALPSGAALGQAWGSGVNGWQVGGYTTNIITNVRRMAFSDDTWTTLTALSAGQRNGRGTSSSTKGYSFGGYKDSPATNLSINHQWTYSTDAFSTGTASGWGTTPTSWAACHGITTRSIFLGGGADGAGGTTKRLQSLYVFSTDTETYSATGGAYGHILAGATGNNEDMVVCGGYRSNADPTNYTTRGTTITRYVVSSGSVVVDSGTIGTAYSHGDAAGNDEVGIFAGSNGNEDRTQRENAYTYATNTDTLLSAYLANNQVATFNNMESPQAFHSGQIS